MYDVLCIAGTNCDLIFAKLEKFPELAKEVECKEFFIKAGGGANTAMALAKLGISTAFATELGKDVLGEIVYKYIENTGVDTSAVLYKDNIRTSVTSVLSIGEERGFATYLLDSMKNITAEQIEEFIQKASHVHTYIGYCDKFNIIELCKKHKKTLSLDTGWSEDMRLEDVKHIISQCDIFMPNELEACQLTATKDAREALEKIGQYPKITVIKRGSQGCLVKYANNVIEAPALSNINVVDTTGAGDLFGAGFIYGYLKGWPLDKTACFASASGGLAVTFYGGMDEEYTFDKVNEYLKSLY